MATAKAVSANAQKLRNSGTVMFGTADGKTVTKVMGKSLLQGHPWLENNVATSNPNLNDGTCRKVGATAILGGYAYVGYPWMKKGKYVMYGLPLDLAGLVTTGNLEAELLIKPSAQFLSGGSVGHVSTHAMERKYSKVISTWNYLTGAATYTTQQDWFGRDDAVPNRTSNEGEFVFMRSSKLQDEASTTARYYSYSRRLNS